MSQLKKVELSSIAISREIGQFNGEVWLSSDDQATDQMLKRLGAGEPIDHILQYGKVHGKELYAEQSLCSSKCSQRIFKDGMAVLISKLSSKSPGMYLVQLHHGENLQWLFRSSTSRAVPVPIACHDGLEYKDGWWPYHSNCLRSLLVVPENGDIILPAELTRLPHYVTVVFQAEREHGPCCMLFKMGQPTRFIPLGMSGIRMHC